jgi:hypothetical protein
MGMALLLLGVVVGVDGVPAQEPAPDARYVDVYMKVVADPSAPIHQRLDCCIKLGRLGPQARKAAPVLAGILTYREPNGFVANVDLYRACLWALQKVGAESRDVVPLLNKWLENMPAIEAANKAWFEPLPGDDPLEELGSIIVEGEMLPPPPPPAWLQNVNSFNAFYFEIIQYLQRSGAQARQAVPALVGVARLQMDALKKPGAAEDDLPPGIGTGGGYSGGQAAPKPLIWIDVRCRLASIAVLGAILTPQDQQAVGALRTIAALDTVPEVRAAAEQALRQIEKRQAK